MPKILFACLALLASSLPTHAAENIPAGATIGFEIMSKTTVGEQHDFVLKIKANAEKPKNESQFEKSARQLDGCLVNVVMQKDEKTGRTFAKSQPTISCQEASNSSFDGKHVKAQVVGDDGKVGLTASTKGKLLFLAAVPN